MADQATKKDILQIVKLSKKYDYSDKQVLRQILELSEQRNMFQSKIGKKYLSRLRDMFEDMAYDDVCIICNKNKTTDGVMCDSCMTSLVASLEKQGKKKEVIEEPEEQPVEEVEPVAVEEPIYEEPVYENPVTLPKSSKIRFCRNCGKMITSAMDRCLLCGTSRDDGYNYCGCCGNPVPMRPVAVERTQEHKIEIEKEENKEKKEKKPFLTFLKKNKPNADEVSEGLLEEGEEPVPEEEYVEEFPEFYEEEEAFVETKEESEAEKTRRIQEKKRSEELFGNVKRKKKFSFENFRMGFIVFFNNVTDGFKSLFSRTDRGTDEYPDNIIKLDVGSRSEGKKRYIVLGVFAVAVIIAAIKIISSVGGYEKVLGKTTAQVEKSYGAPKELMNVNAFKTYEYPEGIKVTFEEGVAQKLYLNHSTKPVFGMSIGQVVDEESLMKKMKTQGLEYKGNVKALDGHINYSFGNNHYNVRIFTLGGMIDEVEVNAQ